MPDAVDRVIEQIAGASGIPLESQRYRAVFAKVLSNSDALGVSDDARGGSHQLHIAVTDPDGGMLAFPLVTSSGYRGLVPRGRRTEEKRRYVAQISVHISRRNLVDVLQRARGLGERWKWSDEDFATAERRAAETGEWLQSTMLVRFNLRTNPAATETEGATEADAIRQQQIEIAPATSRNDDAFSALLHALRTDDGVVFLQRTAPDGTIEYDVLGLAADRALREFAVRDIGGATAPQHGLVKRFANDDEFTFDGLGAATAAKCREVVDAIKRYGETSIIALSGVPGTGKSFIADIVARTLTQEDPHRLLELQFHQNYSYEEFVEGLRITQGGNVAPKHGKFLWFNERAGEAPELPFILLIDEFTRANVPLVLGELLTYLEKRERPFHPLYDESPEQLTATTIAKNLYMLVTYNPADRTAIDLDAAILRRMRIVAFEPDEGQLRDMLAKRGVDDVFIRQLETMFAACRARRDFATLMPFGHGIFSEITDGDTSEELAQLWRQRIHPILYRPLVEPHEFAETIAENYPWK